MVPEWCKVGVLLAVSAQCQMTSVYLAHKVQQTMEKDMSMQDELFSRIKAWFKHHSEMTPDKIHNLTLSFKQSCGEDGIIR